MTRYTPARAEAVVREVCDKLGHEVSVEWNPHASLFVLFAQAADCKTARKSHMYRMDCGHACIGPYTGTSEDQCWRLAAAAIRPLVKATKSKTIRGIEHVTSITEHARPGIPLVRKRRARKQR